MNQGSQTLSSSLGNAEIQADGYDKLLTNLSQLLENTKPASFTTGCSGTTSCQPGIGSPQTFTETKTAHIQIGITP